MQKRCIPITLFLLFATTILALSVPSFSEEHVDSIPTIPLQFPFLYDISPKNHSKDSVLLRDRLNKGNSSLYRLFYKNYLYSADCKNFSLDTVIPLPFLEFIQTKKDCKVINFKSGPIDSINTTLEYTVVSPELIYIRFDSFNDATEKSFYNIYRDLMNKKIILDLRHNEGGTINSLRTISSMFIKKNKIICRIAGNRCRGRTTLKTVNLGIPLPVINSKIAILIGASTENGAEVFCAALINDHRAILIGSRTKGVVWCKRTMQLDDSLSLIVPTDSLYSPKGNPIDGVGIYPHIVISATEIHSNETETVEDLILQKSIEVLNNPKKYRSLIKTEPKCDAPYGK